MKRKVTSRAHISTATCFSRSSALHTRLTAWTCDGRQGVGIMDGIGPIRARDFHSSNSVVSLDLGRGKFKGKKGKSRFPTSASQLRFGADRESERKYCDSPPSFTTTIPLHTSFRIPILVVRYQSAHTAEPFEASTSPFLPLSFSSPLHTSPSTCSDHIPREISPERP